MGLRRMLRKAAAALWRAVRSEDVWREVHVSSDKRPEPTLRRYAYLRKQGVRCYVRNLPSPSGRGISTGMMSLRVHKDDVSRAYALMSEVKD